MRSGLQEGKGAGVRTGGQIRGQMVDFFAPLTQRRNPSGMTAIEGNRDGSVSSSETAARRVDESSLLSQGSEERRRDLCRL